MAIRVACLRCGHAFNVPDKTSGKPPPCPKCGSTQQIQLLGKPTPLEPAAEVPPAAKDRGVPVAAVDEPPASGEPIEPVEVIPPGEPPIPVGKEFVPPEELDQEPPVSALEQRLGPRWPWYAAVAALLIAAAGWAIHAAFSPADSDRTAAAGAGTARTGGIPSVPAEELRSDVRAEQEPDPDRRPAHQPAEAGPNSSSNPGTEEVAVAPSRGPQPASPAPGEAASAQHDTGPPTDSLPVTVRSGSARVAGTLEEAKEALVKFEMPLGIGDLTQYGTGFLIDARGWIATNNHVLARITKAARVELADGSRLEVEGILARAPERDLAIVRLADPPAELTILDIGYDGNPSLGEQVYAFGHPYNADFSLSKGIVSRVLTTTELLDSSRQHLVSRFGAPADMVWIQHDAKISPGNSGGPLLDDGGRVYGVNTFVHLKAEMGYAGHVRYLRELAATVSTSLEPLPDPKELVRTVVSSGRINELFEQISGFGWKPETPEQYEGMAEFAKQMTLAKHAQAARGGTPESAADAVARVAGVADQKFASLRGVSWSKPCFEAINSFAAEQVDQVGEGAMLYSVVLGRVRNQNALLMEIEGTGKLVVLQVGPNATMLPRGSRWLVVGFVTPQVVNVENREESFARQSRVVLTHYMLLVR